MKIKAIISLTFSIFFWVQLVAIIWLGIKIMRVERQLKIQEEKIRTPAMVRGRI